MKVPSIIIGILILALTVALLLGNRSVNYYEDKLEQQRNEYKDKLLLLQQQLSEANNERLDLTNKLDSLNSSLKNVLVDRDKTKAELMIVKGRYDNHTPSELETEMINRWKNGK